MVLRNRDGIKTVLGSRCANKMTLRNHCKNKMVLEKFCENKIVLGNCCGNFQFFYLIWIRQPLLECIAVVKRSSKITVGINRLLKIVLEWFAIGIHRKFKTAVAGNPSGNKTALVNHLDSEKQPSEIVVGIKGHGLLINYS